MARLVSVLPWMLIMVSGYCSLTYQVVWDRVLRFTFGGDSVSASIISSSFLLGLGLGAWSVRRWRANAIRLYGLVEIAIGLYAMVSYYLLTAIGPLVRNVLHLGIDDLSTMTLPTLAGSLLLVVPPCGLMGATLPLMLNSLIRPGQYTSKRLGALYGLNTFGACAGALVTPVFLMGSFPLPAILTGAGLVNVLVGVGLMSLPRIIPHLRAPGEASAGKPAGTQATISKRAYPVGLMAFAAGLFSLTFEICVVRLGFMDNPSSAYVFPFVLTLHLGFMALGSILIMRIAEGDKQRVASLASGMFTVAALALPIGLLGAAGLREFAPMATTGPLVPRLMMLVLNYCVLIGPFVLVISAVFPLTLRLAAPAGRDLPAETGRLYLLNSLGAFAGGLGTQFLGFPALGTWDLLLLLMLSCFLVGVWSRYRQCGRCILPRHLATLPALVVLMAVLPHGAYKDLLAMGQWGTTADYVAVEGRTGVACAVLQGGDADIRVNGTYMSRIPDHPRHAMLAFLARAQNRLRDVLILGLGGGGLVRDVLADPRVRRVETVDWSHELNQLLRRPSLASRIQHCLEDPRVRVRVCDARIAVQTYANDSFDLAVDNLCYVDWAGATSVKSVAYFQSVARILRPDGVFVLEGNYVSQKHRLALLATLRTAFRHVAEHDNQVMFCSNRPIEVDADRVAGLERDYEPRLAGGVDELRSIAEFLNALAAVPAARGPDSSPLIVDSFPRFEFYLLEHFLRRLNAAPPGPRQAAATSAQ